MGDALTSTRVNSALLPRYTGKTVRLTVKPVKFMGTSAIVSACDGGEITVTLLPDTHMSLDSFYEVIGSVANPTTIKMYYCVDMGTDIDMKLVDDTVKLMHDPRFFTKIFSPTD